jgi:hypothetical protein
LATANQFFVRRRSSQRSQYLPPRFYRNVQLDRFASSGEDYGFTRTHIPVVLAQYGDENLVSRSQAKRLLARFDRFKEVFLDFTGVHTIGPAFADEIFRVFYRQHPEIRLVWVNANSEVEKMIRRALEHE